MRFLIQLLDAGTNTQGMARRAIRVYEVQEKGVLDRGTLHGASSAIGQTFAQMRAGGFAELPAVLTSNKELTSLKKMRNAVPVNKVNFDKLNMGHQFIAHIGLAQDELNKGK